MMTTLLIRNLHSLKNCILTLISLLFVGSTLNAQSGTQCFIKQSDPNTVNAKVQWWYNATDPSGSSTYTIRVTFSKGFVDNTYGTTAIGWTHGHKFNDLVGSDNVELALNDASGTKRMDFHVDYISATNTVPSGYKSLGVSGGDGKMVTGSSSDVVRWITSLDSNFNVVGCSSFKTNSPSTDANYSPSPECPGWDFNVWYEVTVKASAFPGGLGSVNIPYVHASPSKTGNNTEIVVPGPCPGSVSLGNQIFEDVNESGRMDAGDKGIANVQVKLYKCSDNTLVSTTTTDANGFYYFNNLADGSYYIGVVKPTGFSIGGTSTSSANPNNDIDNDNNGVTDAGNEVRTNCITLTQGQEPTNNGNSNFTLDVGLHNNNNSPNGGEFCFASQTNGSCVNARAQYTINGDGTITVRVIFSKCFVDNTYGNTAVGWPNGHKFGDLVGSDNVEMALYDANGTKKMDFHLDYISSTTTSPSGYKSLGVTGGDGKMVLGNASDVIRWKTSLDANFNDYGYSSYTTNSPATDANYTPNPATPNWIYDVWYEATVNASAFGPAGFGSIQIPYVHASPSKTGNNTEIVVPVPCPSLLRLGNQVFEDVDNNGWFGGHDVGVAGVTVKLYNTNGGVVSTTTTDVNGKYLFSGLAAGNYIVGITPPSGYVQGATTTSSANPNNDLDNDNNGVNVQGNGEIRSNQITLTVLGEPTNDGDDANGNLTLDFGLHQNSQISLPVCLGNQVWYDTNGNGKFDAGEAGVASATVNLYADANGDNVPDGPAIATTTTNSAGVYVFNNLTAGKYIVGVILPDNYMATAVTSSSFNVDNNIDNDNNGVTTLSNANGTSELISHFITLAGTETNCNNTVDFGIEACGTLTIGDYVWEDTNMNGLQDVDEYGIPDVHVTLTLPNGQTQVTTTNANGYYYFTNLVPGNYVVCFETPAGYRPTIANAGPDDRDSDPVNGGCVTVTLANTPPGNFTIDAGFVLVKLNLGNKVFNDLNENGVWDAGEPGLAGVRVNLYSDNNGDNQPDGMAITSTVTDANGIYGFSNLTAGRYIVGVVLPTGYMNSAVPFTGVNPDDDVDNDNNGIVTFNNEVFSRYITLSPGSEPTNDGDGPDGNLTLDFGLMKCPPPPYALTLGNRIWDDLNNNGRCDAGEPGIAGVLVKLYTDSNGDNVPDVGGLVATTTTSSDGTYLFTNLDNGKYIVSIVLPHGFGKGFAIPSGATPDNDIDCDNNGVTASNGEVRTNYITLQAGTEPTNDGDDNNGNLTLDIGLLETGNIILPITLINFNGAANGNDAQLSWQVANEVNMSEYVLQRSSDARTFTDLGSVAATNSTSNHTYHYTDANTNGGVLYYRLRIVGKDGSQSYSNIVVLRFGAARNTFTVYPNPAKGFVTLNIGATENTDAKVQLFNTVGQAVQTRSISLSKGSNALTLDGLSQYTNGTYRIVVTLSTGEQFGQTLLIAH